MPVEEEETASMKELVEQINAHIEPDEMEATSIPNAQDQLGGDLHFPMADQQQPEAANQTGPSTLLSYLSYCFSHAFTSFYCIFFFYFLVNLPMSPSCGD